MSNGVDLRAAAGVRREQEIESKLLYAAYSRLPLNMWLTLICTLLFVPLLWRFFSIEVMLGALIALLLNVAFSWWHATRFQHAAPQTHALAHWQDRFLFHHLLAGVSWAVGPALAAPQASPTLLALSVGILFSVCAVAVNSASEQRGAAQAFVVGALALPAVVIVANSPAFGIEWIVALVLLAGMVSMIAVCRATHRTLRKLLETEWQLREAVAETAAARDLAERNNLAKSQFLSRMSHELRTPLHSILGFASLLEADRSLAGERRDDVREILRSGRHLLVLINELLDISAIESGHMQLKAEAVSLTTLISDCRRMVQPLADEKHITLRMEPGARVSEYAFADSLRLREALLNLLSNAIKYNHDHGTVSISVKQAGDTRIRIVVTDTGIGISAGDMARLFQPYSRLPPPGVSTHGTGIGLTITHRLVELMGGSVGVDSKPGAGSSFWMELPAAGAGEREQALETLMVHAATGAAAAKRRVLYIDDRIENLQLVERILRRRPHVDLTIVESAVRGLDIARGQHLDLLLLDINMPVMDGYDVLAALKAEARLRELPVIALSADAMPHDIERGRAAGFTEYLTKPLDIAGFLEVIDRYLPAPLAPAQRWPGQSLSAEARSGQAAPAADEWPGESRRLH